MEIATSKIHSALGESHYLGKVVDPTKMAKFMDGGVFANNPALCAFFEAKQLFGYDKEIVIVSLGTGHLPKKFNEHTPSGWLKLSGMLPWALFDVKEIVSTNLLRQLMVEDENLFRFDMTIERHENDQFSLMGYYRNRAAAWLRKHEHEKAKLQALGRFLSKFADSELPEQMPQT